MQIQTDTQIMLSNIIITYGLKNDIIYHVDIVRDIQKMIVKKPIFLQYKINDYAIILTNINT